MTIMFCDLVGSTSLAAQLDPEDLRDVLTAYQTRASALIEAAGGTIARYEGDGILAYFGYPEAHEDDAERAVSTALELARGIDVSAPTPQTLSVRVGLATGVVLVGDLLPSRAADRPTVVGEHANLAARMQEMAEPNGVVISDDTHRLTGALFDYRNLGVVSAKGMGRGVQAWQVLGRSKAVNRFRALRSSAPCAGRDREIALLLDRWARAETGHGGLVLISGEAGIGKSRLLMELIARVGPRKPTILRYDCSPQHQNSALYPLLDRLRRRARAEGQDVSTPELLRRILPGDDAHARAATSLLADLLAEPVPSTIQPADADTKSKRTLLFEAVVRNLQQASADGPVLLLLEDAHWIDATSLELLYRIAGAIAGHAILIIVTSRPEFRPAWPADAPVTTVELGPLDHANTRLLIKRLPGAERLPEHLTHDIATRSDGIPLYAEELTRMVVDGSTAAPGTPAAAALPAIPTSLHALLASRLDRLGDAREVARVAAAVGREFPADLLRHVAGGTIGEALDQLERARILLPSRDHPEHYRFRHALIQDAAYATLPRERRKALHERIAIALETHFPDVCRAHPEVLASHFTKAGRNEPAIRYWTAAGQRAIRGSALKEAEKHLTDALSLVAQLPPSPVNAATELELLLLLGPVMTALKGYASDDALRVFSRADELARDSGTAAQQLDVLAGLFNVHYGRAELAQARTVAEQHMALAKAEDRELPRAHCFTGQIHLVEGNFEDARTHFEQALAIFHDHPEDPRSLGVYGSQYVVACAFLAGVYWALGEPEKAEASTARSVEYANRLGHLVSIALAQITRLLTPIPGRLEPDADGVDDALRFCRRHGLSNFEAWARLAEGAIVARVGDPQIGIPIIEDAIAAAARTGSRLFRPVQLATLASAHAKLKDVPTALRLVTEALEIAERTGERRANAAIYRLQGELLAWSGRPDDAARALQRSLEVAIAQKAPFEVRRTQKVIAKLLGQSPSAA